MFVSASSKTKTGGMTKTKYGAIWPAASSDLQIELGCIQKGGTWKNKRGLVCGEGLQFHHQQVVNLCWPKTDNHRWHETCLKAMCENRVTVLMGPGSSGKTHEASKWALVEYWADPDNTTILISSTDARGLELRIWGEIKKLWQEAKDRFDWLPGHPLDSKHCLSTDKIEEDQIRDLRNGIIGIPCIVGTRFLGLGKYVGIKNTRVRLIADEAQFMPASFLESIPNLEKNLYDPVNNRGFKAVILGNPLDPTDSLGKAAEPCDGWTSVGEPDKTTTWKTRFDNGICVNLVGTDSPNFDFPQDEPPRFPYLVCNSSIASTVSFYSKQSQQYFTQCVGIMKTGLIARRVISREMCRQFETFDPVVWSTTKRTKIYAVDAAYGNIGGDRCVGGDIEFGKDIRERTVIEVHPPVIVPVTYQLQGTIPEDQIAEFVRGECENKGIPPENVFFDATGRGSLGTSFARIWSAQVNPIEFGGVSTLRPVCQDLFIVDEKTKTRRLKLCSEHYSKFVTELWFSVRYVVESNQLRSLPDEVMDEGCKREWKIVRGNRIEIETKAEMKLRTGRSPDMFDWLATAVEGARRRGFQISKLANEMPQTQEWKETLLKKSLSLQRRSRLNFAV